MGNVEKNILIYDSGVKLFKKFGPKKVSIDMIVKDAGVGKGTFYNYFKNKDELYEKIVFDIIGYGKEYMNSLLKQFPDPKERLMVDFLNSLEFFCGNNGIIGNLMHENPDYYLGKINLGYLEKVHREMISILFSDIYEKEFKNNSTLLEFARDIFGFYKHANSLRCMYKTEEEFKNFMTKLAYFFIEGLFSETFLKIPSQNYDMYKDKLRPFKGKFDFMKKY